MCFLEFCFRAVQGFYYFICDWFIVTILFLTSCIGTWIVCNWYYRKLFRRFSGCESTWDYDESRVDHALDELQEWYIQREKLVENDLVYHPIRPQFGHKLIHSSQPLFHEYVGRGVLKKFIEYNIAMGLVVKIRPMDKDDDPSPRK